MDLCPELVAVPSPELNNSSSYFTMQQHAPALPSVPQSRNCMLGKVWAVRGSRARARVALTTMDT